MENTGLLWAFLKCSIDWFASSPAYILLNALVCFLCKTALLACLLSSGEILPSPVCFQPAKMHVARQGLVLASLWKDTKPEETCEGILTYVGRWPWKSSAAQAIGSRLRPRCMTLIFRKAGGVLGYVSPSVEQTTQMIQVSLNAFKWLCQPAAHKKLVEFCSWMIQPRVWWHTLVIFLFALCF